MPWTSLRSPGITYLQAWYRYGWLANWQYLVQPKEPVASRLRWQQGVFNRFMVWWVSRMRPPTYCGGDRRRLRNLIAFEVSSLIVVKSIPSGICVISHSSSEKNCTLKPDSWRITPTSPKNQSAFCFAFLMRKGTFCLTFDLSFSVAILLDKLSLNLVAYSTQNPE